MVEREQSGERVEEIERLHLRGNHARRIEDRREIEQGGERDRQRVVDVVVEHRQRRDRQREPHGQHHLEHDQHRHERVARRHPVMVQHDQQPQDDRDLGQELDQPRAGGAEDQELAGERHAAGEPRMFGEDPGAGAERLQGEVPDEVAAQQERPVVRHLDAHHVAEHHHQDGHGEQRVDQRPHETQQRALILDLEVAHHEPAQQLPVAPQLPDAGERAPVGRDGAHARAPSRRHRASRRARAHSVRPAQQFHHMRTSTGAGSGSRPTARRARRTPGFRSRHAR